MLMPTGCPPAGTDRVWSIMLSQLERASLPRQPACPESREGRYAIRLVQRPGQGPVTPESATRAEVFDAMSCMVIACSCLGREVSTRSADDGTLLVCFVTRQHAARVTARLGPVLASCNERLRNSPWEVVAARMGVH